MTKRLFDMITDGPPSPEAKEELALFRQATAKAANRAARMGVTPTGLKRPATAADESKVTQFMPNRDSSGRFTRSGASDQRKTA
jgi:hypothetical protein